MLHGINQNKLVYNGFSVHPQQHLGSMCINHSGHWSNKHHTTTLPSPESGFPTCVASYKRRYHGGSGDSWRFATRIHVRLVWVTAKREVYNKWSIQSSRSYHCIAKWFRKSWTNRNFPYFHQSGYDLQERMTQTSESRLPIHLHSRQVQWWCI